MDNNPFYFFFFKCPKTTTIKDADYSLVVAIDRVSDSNVIVQVMTYKVWMFVIVRDVVVVVAAVVDRGMGPDCSPSLAFVPSLGLDQMSS